MSKTYTGMELLQAIKSGEIKNGNRFKIINGGLEDFIAWIEDKNLKIDMFGKEGWLGTNSLIESDYELLDEDIDIQEIEEYKSEYTMNCVESEIKDKINELIKAVKQLDNKINN